MIATEKDFQKSYSIFLGKAWSSASNMAMAKADPVSALNEAGFDIAAGAHVDLEAIGGYSSLDDQYSLYQIGQKTGNYTIVLPAAPPSLAHITTATLSSYDDGGSSSSSSGSGTSYCCCCCPCCSCT